MYSSFQLAKKYFQYYIVSKNGKGHGIHSPFVYDFVIHVLNDTKKYRCYDSIELLRKQLLNNHTQIDVEDFGAGSALVPFKTRKIKDIAKSSLKNKKFAQLLFRIAHYYQLQIVVELGTSLGITASYLACANPEATVYTFEGSQAIANIAKQNFSTAGLQNITMITGNFEETFLKDSAIVENISLAFVDGNHRKAPTLDYFSHLLARSTELSILIFDDIHWSQEMEEAWIQIQEHPAVTLTIDLFFIGIVLFNPDFKVKQHFTIRF